MLSALTVRHPLDSYLSYRHNSGLYRDLVLNLDQYSLRYIKFLRAYDGVYAFKYEDFCLNPVLFMEQLCACLQVEFHPGFMQHFGNRRASV